MRSKRLQRFKILDNIEANVADVPKGHDPAEINNKPFVQKCPFVERRAFGIPFFANITSTILCSGRISKITEKNWLD
jgi:hypothetical protein